jgi:UDPglucose 6-dehydrogenase
MSRKPNKPTIAILGLGIVGLTIAASLARKGYEVTGIELDDEKLIRIARASKRLFYEPSLTRYVAEAKRGGNLHLSNNSHETSKADIVYVAVGTPSNEDGSVNLEQVSLASKQVGQSLRGIGHFQIIIIKSTVPPGSARKLILPMIESQSARQHGQGFGVCSNPEFLREGNAIYDEQHPDRIVLGTDDAPTMNYMSSFYTRLYGKKIPQIHTTFENAEFIKYASNAFLAAKVSFINSIATVAERTAGADIKVIARGIGLDKRIGEKFLNAGLGWGGSCFPKDLDELIHYCRLLHYAPKLLEAAVEVNNERARKAVEIARTNLGSLADKRVAILGLSYKPETNDMRNAVSIKIIHALLTESAEIVTYDPAAINDAREIFGDRIQYAKNAVECIRSADCAVLVTEWGEFEKISPLTFKKLMREPLVIDGRRIYDPVTMIAAGVRFHAIGLGPAIPN